jgi:hypothetical protein
MLTPTDEQQHAIDVFNAGRSVALEALAGSGKTSTLKMLAHRVAGGDRGVYTAFSAQVVRDAKSAFPSTFAVKSNHGLAFPSFGAAYQNAGRLDRRLTPRVLLEHFGWNERTFAGLFEPAEGAYLALATVLRFQQSADQRVGSEHVHLPGSVDEGERGEAEHCILSAADRIWAAIADPMSRLPVNHDSYLKLWALSNPRLNADVIALDEAQDANAVIIDVLAKQSAQMVIVGDRFQQIYSFRGAVNAMTSFDVDERAWLTQSFRFGNATAQAANAVLAGHLGSDVRVRGNPAITDRLGTIDAVSGPRTLIARTNAMLIGQIADAPGVVAVVGGVGELMRLVDGADRLLRGERAITCPDLMDFRTWGEVTEYAKSDAGRDLSVLTRLVDDYGTDGLRGLLATVDGNERNEAECDLILTTAHKSKGREWDATMLASDFQCPSDGDLGIEGGSPKTGKWTPEEANLLYVAVTRAQRFMDVEGVEAWVDALDRCNRANILLPGLNDAAVEHDLPPPRAAHPAAPSAPATPAPTDALVEALAAMVSATDTLPRVPQPLAAARVLAIDTLAAHGVQAGCRPEAELEPAVPIDRAVPYREAPTRRSAGLFAALG